MNRIVKKYTLGFLSLLMVCVSVNLAAVGLLSVNTLAETETTMEISGNGLNGIYIDINSEAYVKYANKSYGEYAYTGEGCAWFANSRMYELTGTDTPIYSGSSWYNTRYSEYGLTRGSEPKEKCLVCYSSHIAVLEKIDGDTYTVSEGGMSYVGSDCGDCIIHTMTREKLESSRAGTFLGYVYFETKADKLTLNDAKVVSADKNGYTLSVKVSSVKKASIVRCATWTESNGQDDLAWNEMSYNNGSYTFYVPFKNHNNEQGNYINHIYAWDAEGTQCEKPLAVNYNANICSFSNMRVTEIDGAGYTITADVSNTEGITIVMPTWTTNNSQDDIDQNWNSEDSGVKASVSGNSCNFRVEFSKHNNENGVYASHAYAYNSSGMYILLAGLSVDVEKYDTNGKIVYCIYNNNILIGGNGPFNIFLEESELPWHSYLDSDSSITSCSTSLKLSGWNQYNGNWCYIDKTGITLTGWVKLSNKWYYFNSTGGMQTGWVKLSNKWYYFNESGVMQTGWVKLNSKWYFFNESGVMQTGWVKLNSKWYYFNGSGVMQTGWVKLSNKWYYFNESGVMQTEKWVGNYYLKADGSMAVSEWVDKGRYYVGSDGKWVNGK